SARARSRHTSKGDSRRPVQSAAAKIADLSPHRPQAIRECASSHEPLLRHLSTRLLHAAEIRRRNGGYVSAMTTSRSLLARRWSFLGSNRSGSPVLCV